MAACAEAPGARVLNAADPDRPTASGVVRATAAASRHPVQVVGLDDAATPGWGWTPWDTWPPFFLDSTASTRLGYRPAGTYADTVAPVVRKLLEFSGEQRTRLALDDYFDRRFDYAIDDAALEYQARSTTGRAPGSPGRELGEAAP